MTEPEVEQRLRFTCAACGARYRDPGNLFRHWEDKHGNRIDDRHRDGESPGPNQ